MDSNRLEVEDAWDEPWDDDEELSQEIIAVANQLLESIPDESPQKPAQRYDESVATAADSQQQHTEAEDDVHHDDEGVFEIRDYSVCSPWERQALFLSRTFVASLFLNFTNPDSLLIWRSSLKDGGPQMFL